eukprot:CAMPEP_0118930264 /NCGR_PEP_ID=MMETSP1169-20130426/7007_1 /TAXON_ID=36882 /ORGANISM="Pyramimonas obovata, Strain CCMP722" /LENGTH=352 /DNA_ID=CAMNT_0006872589 /DNA_START=198 /DNA_END=1253 /DNA_ORIENTATION=+
MTELMEAGVSLVEHLHIKRQPMPNASVIYFIRPTQKSVNQLIEDFASEKKPMYQCASVFFCSKIRPALLTSIKSAPKVLERLVDLKEVNVEVLALEPRVFVTENTDALRVLYGKNAAQSLRFEMTIESIATRLATVFASLNEFPSIRFAAPKASSGTQPTTDTEAARSRLAQQVAQRVHAQLSTLQSQSASIPAHATCDLLVVDRTLDLVAPVVHELTYEAMCYDLLPHEGDSFSYATTTQGGKQEQKAAVLTEADPLWMELRHLHIADVWISLEHKTKEFKATNRIAAQQARQAADQSKGKKMSDAELKRAAEGLSHYQKVVNKLDQHTTLSNLLSHTMESRCLTRLREFE